MFPRWRVDGLAGMLRKVVWGIVYHEHLRCQRLYVFSECRPRFRECRFLCPLPFVFFILLVVACYGIVVACLYAGNDNGVYAVMDMIVS